MDAHQGASVKEARTLLQTVPWQQAAKAMGSGVKEVSQQAVAAVGAGVEGVSTHLQAVPWKQATAA